MDAQLLSCKKRRYCEHGFTSHVITCFAWKNNGSTVPCEQRKTIEQFPVDKVPVPCECCPRQTRSCLRFTSNVTAACPKDVLEFKFFWEPCCIIVIYRLLWSPYTVHSSGAPSQGYLWKGSWSSPYKNPGENTEIVHSSLYKPCSLNFLHSCLLHLHHLQKVPQTNFF